MKEHRKSELFDKVSTEDTAVALCVTREPEAVLGQDDATTWAKNFKSETTNTMDPDVVFKVPQT